MLCEELCELRFSDMEVLLDTLSKDRSLWWFWAGRRFDFLLLEDESDESLKPGRILALRCELGAPAKSNSVPIDRDR